MKVILGCDPLLGPLTGIGNYTKSLALGFESSPDIDLQLFAHGKFFNKDLIVDQPTDNLVQEHKPSLFQQLRQQLAKSKLATQVYSQVFPHIERYSLSKHSDSIFHSPNFLLPQFAGKKVVTIHDLSTIRFPQFHPQSRIKLVNKAIEEAVKNADHIITDSNFVKNELTSMFAVDESKVSAIHLGVNEVFHPRKEAQCTAILDQFRLKYQSYFLFVSTIEPRKNLQRLLTAYELYLAKHKVNTPLVIIGGKGWQSAQEHEKIKELELKGLVKYLGYVPDAAMPIVYAGAKALLFPSLYEGFGLPVAEALQSGIKVLTSQQSSMAEFAQGNTVFVDPLEIESIMQGIEQLEHAPISTQSHIFRWDEVVKSTIDIYRTVSSN